MEQYIHQSTQPTSCLKTLYQRRPLSKLSSKSNFYSSSSHTFEQPERGVIINVSSSMASSGTKGMVSYAATKGAIIGMTLPMARDLGRYGIRVLNIAPSLFKTPLVEMAGQEMFNEAAKMVPLNRVGECDEFAHLVVKCAENSYLNGVSIDLNGGLIAPDR